MAVDAVTLVLGVTQTKVGMLTVIQLPDLQPLRLEGWECVREMDCLRSRQSELTEMDNVMNILGVEWLAGVVERGDVNLNRCELQCLIQAVR